MKIKNKILLIILFALCVLLLSVSSVKASSDKTLMIDGYDMSDVYNHFSEGESFFICKFSPTDYRILIPKSGYSSYRVYCGLAPSTSLNSICYYNANWQSLEGNNYDAYLFNTSTLKFNYGYSGAYDGFKLNNYTVAYANNGVYNRDHTTFFMNPPPPEEIPETPETESLAEIMKTAGEQATMEMTQIILVVITVMVGLIVLLVGFKKGFQVLVNGLRH